MLRASIALTLSLLACVIAGPSWCQEFPYRPIRIVVPQPPGGTGYERARAFRISRACARSEHRDRKPRRRERHHCRGSRGEGGARRPHASYTSNSFANNQLAYRKLPFDVLRDFAAITEVARLPGYLVIVNAQVPAQSMKELIEASRNERNQLKYGSGGIGNSQHLLGELVNIRSGAKLMHVPYKGLPLIVTALLGNEVQVAFTAPTVVIAHIKAGRVRALAYTGAKRWPVMPELPTVGETIPGFVFEAAWHGMFAPAATPAAIVTRIQGEVAIQMPKMREFLEAGGYVPVGDTPAEFRAFLKRYLQETAEHMRIAKVQPE